MTPLYAGVGGVVRELTEMYTGVGGVVKPMTEMWAGIGGVNRQIFSAVPKVGDLEIGDIFPIKENGRAQNYIVVHQGLPSSMYDASCDGTWLLRKDIAEDRIWSSAVNNVLESSDILAYLNGDWLDRYDSDIRNAIKQVKIPYRSGGASGTDQSGANGLLCKIFLLSPKELGFSGNSSRDVPDDGAKLSYFLTGENNTANKKRIANFNGSPHSWWTRSQILGGSPEQVWIVNSAGSFTDWWSSEYTAGVRPVLILPPKLPILD